MILGTEFFIYVDHCFPYLRFINNFIYICVMIMSEKRFCLFCPVSCEYFSKIMNKFDSFMQKKEIIFMATKIFSCIFKINVYLDVLNFSKRYEKLFAQHINHSKTFFKAVPATSSLTILFKNITLLKSF